MVISLDNIIIEYLVIKICDGLMPDGITFAGDLPCLFDKQLCFVLDSDSDFNHKFVIVCSLLATELDN